MKAETSLRGSFQATRPAHASSVSTTQAEAIRQKENRITERALSHFERHQQAWTTRRYGELLARDAPVPVLRPEGGMEDRTARLMRAARYLTESKQASRLHRIKDAAARMQTGKSLEGAGR
jgi:hypothetical protein